MMEAVRILPGLIEAKQGELEEIEKKIVAKENGKIAMATYLKALGDFEE